VNQLELFTFGFPMRNSAIIHRTVRCATGQCPVHHRTVRCTSGATAICAQRSTLTDEQYRDRSQSSGQRGTGLSGATPDCPVPHEDKASNGRPAQRPIDEVTWRRTDTVRWRTGLSGGAPDCPVRPSPADFTNGQILVGGYKYHPNRPLQKGGAQATFQVI
jgi:hypothetical protein